MYFHGGGGGGMRIDAANKRKRNGICDVTITVSHRQQMVNGHSQYRTISSLRFVALLLFNLSFSCEEYLYKMTWPLYCKLQITIMII